MKLARQINLAILTTLLVVVSLAGALSYLSVKRGFEHYVRSLEEARLGPAVRRLTAVYARDGSWETLRHDPRRFGRLLRRDEDERAAPPPEGRSREQREAGEARPPRPEGSADASARPPPPEQRERRDTDPFETFPRVTLYDASRKPVVGDSSLDTDATRIPLVVESRTVGWLGVRPITRFDEKIDVGYLQHVRGQLAVIAAAALVLGLVAAAILTRRILRPVEALAAGTRRLTSGDYDARSGVDSADELGQLARDFDTLAATLAENARSRRQWVADTSHELRTPLAVLRAEVEAIVDGVRPADAAAIASLHAEILRLGKLVDDLGELARSDRGALELIRAPIAVVPFLEESLAIFRARFEQRRIAIDLDVAGLEQARISGERVRLQQIFANLLENSARYTDVGGVLRVSGLVGRDPADSGESVETLRLRFDDSAPAVPAEALPHLFERFFRADASRSREAGGSGLGLAICQRLVAAHDGTVVASPSPLGGLRIELTFPLFADPASRPSHRPRPPAGSKPPSP